MKGFQLDFLKRLETDEQVESYYSAIDLLNEYQNVERISSKTTKSQSGMLSHLPVLDSYLTRIKKHNSKDDSEESKIALIYLYTTISSKISYIKGYLNAGVIVNLNMFLDVVHNEIKDMKELRRETIINKRQKIFDESLEQRIRNAKHLIEKRIVPGITELYNQIDNKTNMLITDISHLHNETQEAKDHQKQLKYLVKLKTAFSTLKLVAQSLPYFGPPVAIASVALTGTITLSEAVMIASMDADSEEQVLADIADHLSAEQEREINQITKDSKSPIDILEGTLYLLVRTESLVEKGASNDLMIIRQRFTELRQSIDGIYDTAEIRVLRDELKKYVTVKRRSSSVEIKQMENKKDKDCALQQLAQLEIADRVIGDIKLPPPIFDMAMKSKEQLDKSSKTTGPLDRQLIALKQMESRVNEIVQPMFQALQRGIRSKHASGKVTHTDSIYEQWLSQSNLANVRKIVSEIQQTFFGLEQEYAYQIEALIDEIDLMIDIHNQIEKYADERRLGSNIKSVKATIDALGDQSIKDAMIKLENMMVSNIVLERYERVYNAYKQHNFPFAVFFLGDHELPLNYNLSPAETRVYVMDAARKINEIVNAKMKWESTQNANHNKLNKINSTMSPKERSVNNRPFFVWEYIDHAKHFERLFNGEEIELDANILDGLDQNVVKFKEIGIYFSISDTKLQKQFYEKISHFSVILKISGKNYYRCDNSIYYTTLDDEFMFKFALKPDNRGRVVFEPLNDAYINIINGDDYFLSPYATWRIQLQKEDLSFVYLSEFKGKAMDLELVGVGKYLEKDKSPVNVCNRPLYVFYDVDREKSKKMVELHNDY